jgi:type II secretory pathway pseudopilin PulG
MSKKIGDFFVKTNKGQIWVETVIYTLIAFAMIGLVLAFVQPKIEEIQDKGLIEQSISVLEDIDDVIRNVGASGAGNQRIIELGINKGVLKIDGNNERIFFEIESRYTYSEPGDINVSVGSVTANTKERGNLNIVTLSLIYDEEYDITYNGENQLKTISKASTPYKILFSNEGGAIPVIDIRVTS